MILAWSQRSPETENSFTVITHVPATENMGPRFLAVKNAVAAHHPLCGVQIFFPPEVVPTCQILFHQV